LRLGAHEFSNGLVDPACLQVLFQSLGPERWKKVPDGTGNISNGARCPRFQWRLNKAFDCPFAIAVMSKNTTACTGRIIGVRGRLHRPVSHH
jgi:hypothetical protein